MQDVGREASDLHFLDIYIAGYPNESIVYYFYKVN